MMKKPRSILGGVGFYAVLLVCVAAVGTGAYFLLFPGNSAAEPSDASTAASSAEYTETAGQPEITEPVTPVEPPVPEKIEEDTEPAMTVETAPSTPVAAQTPVVTVEPLEGEVVAAFSVDQLQYSQTLADWRTHDGMDIAAAEGTKVLAARAGTVTEVINDELMGTTVVLSHAGGYQTTYANLQKKPPVAKGDTVSAGQTVGTVGTTALAEAAEGPHLHFSVTKNGDAVDPETFLNR